MFPCTGCGRITDPGTKMARIPTEVRRVMTAHNRVDPTGRVVANAVGNGHETAKEAQFCPECAARDPKPRVVGSVNRVHTYA